MDLCPEAPWLLLLCLKAVTCDIVPLVKQEHSSSVSPGMGPFIYAPTYLTWMSHTTSPLTATTASKAQPVKTACGTEERKAPLENNPLRKDSSLLLCLPECSLEDRFRKRNMDKDRKPTPEGCNVWGVAQVVMKFTDNLTWGPQHCWTRHLGKQHTQVHSWWSTNCWRILHAGMGWWESSLTSLMPRKNANSGPDNVITAFYR